jgi:hypothetical protein
MTAAKLAPIYDDLLDFLVQKATPQEILAFHASDPAQQRAEELAERNSAGTLTPDETAELQQMLLADRLVSLLKARALAILHRT